jgi:nucleotide-binding universal stress UspA family protein
MIEAIETSERFRRILVPLDGSAFAEEALAYAVALSPHYSPMLLLRVIAGERERSSPKHAYGGSSDDEVRKERQPALEYLVETATKLREKGALVRPVASVAVGDPAEQIVRTAHERGYNLIVMSSHGRGAVGRIAYGSVADRVARTSPVPVLITRPSREDEADEDQPLAQRLVVPLDGSALAEQALQVAAQLALRIGVPVLLVSVVDLWGNSSPSVFYPASLDVRFYDEAMSELEHERKEMLTKIAARLQSEGVTVKTQTLRGPVPQAIMAATQPDDIIVMTSHAHSGFSRFLLGSVAEKLVRECQAPVLLVPPVPALAIAMSLAPAKAVAMTS